MAKTNMNNKVAIATIFILVCAIVFIFALFFKKEYAMLPYNLENMHTQKVRIIEYLEKNNIPYRLQGNLIFVPSAKLADIQNKLAKTLSKYTQEEQDKIEKAYEKIYADKISEELRTKEGWKDLQEVRVNVVLNFTNDKLIASSLPFVERINVEVIIEDSFDKHTSSEGRKYLQLEKNEIRKFVQNLAGLDDKRGDKITIDILPITQYKKIIEQATGRNSADSINKISKKTINVANADKSSQNMDNEGKKDAISIQEAFKNIDSNNAISDIKASTKQEAGDKFSAKFSKFDINSPKTIFIITLILLAIFVFISLISKNKAKKPLSYDVQERIKTGSIKKEDTKQSPQIKNHNHTQDINNFVKNISSNTSSITSMHGEQDLKHTSKKTNTSKDISQAKNYSEIVRALEDITKIEPKNLSHLIRAMLKENLSRQVAITFLHMDDIALRAIFAYLDIESISEISKEIVKLDYVKQPYGEQVVRDFYNLYTQNRHIKTGGYEYAKELLYKTLGQAKVNEVLKTLKTQGETKREFAYLAKIKNEEIARALEDENPQTIALILSRIEAKKAAKILECFTHELRSKVFSRITNIKPISNQLLERISQGLEEQIIQNKQSGKMQADEIISNIDPSIAHELKEVVENAESSKPSKNEATSTPSQSAQNSFAIDDVEFESINFLSEDSIKILLDKIEPKLFACALKGAREKTKQKVLNAMGEGSSSFVKKMRYMGAMPIKKVESAQGFIVQTLKELIGSGVIRINKIGEGFEKDKQM